MNKFKKMLLNRWFIAGAGLAAWSVVAVLVVSASVIGNYNRFVLKDDKARQSHEVPVGLVLGAGITDDGKPYRELQSRLDTAATALKAGQVSKLIVSGDNRFKKYDEPTAMKNYLVNVKGIDPDKIQPDYAGRSTYESCERASKVFKLDKTIIFSAGSHLPRAIYLCRHFGVEAYGVASTAEANNATRREAFARVKAMFNIYVHGENTILGAPIPIK